MLDPTKEIQAEAMACENGFSTHADSALRLNGSDYDSNIEQLAREKARMQELLRGNEADAPDGALQENGEDPQENE